MYIRSIVQIHPLKNSTAVSERQETFIFKICDEWDADTGLLHKVSSMPEPSSTEKFQEQLWGSKYQRPSSAVFQAKEEFINAWINHFKSTCQRTLKGRHLK